MDDHGAGDSKKTMKYSQKWVSICSVVKNLVVFVAGCQKNEGGTEVREAAPQRGQQRKQLGSKNEGGFIELSDLSSKRSSKSTSQTRLDDDEDDEI
jgi:hypothetical protein